MVWLATGCGAAVAETSPGKFAIRIAGDATFSSVYVSQSYDAANSVSGSLDFANQFRLQIVPRAIADNGLEYGASLRLRAKGTDGLIDADQAYLFADGAFGRLEAGVNASPNHQFGVTAPGGFGTGGVIGDWAEGQGRNTVINNQTTFLEPVFGGGYNNITKSYWATRLSYFSPRVLTQEDEYTGLMGYVSYAPRNLSVNTNANRGYRLTTVVPGASSGNDFCSQQGTAPTLGCHYKNIAEAGFRYDGSFKKVSLVAGAAYERGEAPTSNGANPGGYYNLSAYQAGFQLGYAGVLIGGSYLNAGRSAYSRGTDLFLDDQSTVTAGITYEMGPLVIGFNYAYGQDAGDPTVPGKRTANLYATGASYVLSPGFVTGIEYLRSITRNEAGFVTDGFGNDAQGSSAFTGFGSGNATAILWKSVISF